MTFNELYVLLKTTGIPQKRMKSKTVLSPPYLVICEGEAEYGGADLKVLLKQHNPRIELIHNRRRFYKLQHINAMLNKQ